MIQETEAINISAERGVPAFARLADVDPSSIVVCLVELEGLLDSLQILKEHPKRAESQSTC